MNAFSREWWHVMCFYELARDNRVHVRGIALHSGIFFSSYSTKQTLMWKAPWEVCLILNSVLLNTAILSSWLEAPCKKFKLSRAGPKDMFDNMTPRHQIAWCRWMFFAIIRKLYSAANGKYHRNLQLVQMQQRTDHGGPSPSLHICIIILTSEAQGTLWRVWEY